MRIVLASGSPRRRELLSSIGVDFDVVVPDVDESRHPDENPVDYVERIARSKVRAVDQGDDRIVIGADTTVVYEGKVMGKPEHPTEARAMLERLSGDTHTVFTGVAVTGPDGLHSAVADTRVTFAPLTAEEIDGYIASGEPMDKAGAYGLQGLGAVFVTRVDGSPSNVIGLPLDVTATLLRRHGVDPLRR